METTDVLVIGAGPTGLVLALWLTRLGVRVRIVDKAAEPGQTSRAIAVQSRTLELYDQVGLAGPVVDDGLKLAAANLWVKGTHRARLEFGTMGEGLSPFPYALMYPQDAHEKLLVEHLRQAGLSVDRPTELTRLEVKEDRVVAEIAHAGGSTEKVEAKYVAGCDGARSLVRETLGVGFAGGTYAHLFYVADVEASGPQANGELHAALDESDFVACFPMKGNGRVRLVGTVREDAVRDGEKVDWGDVHQTIVERIHLSVRRVNWLSTYRVHHRVASAFRVGRAFLLGDAAHIHSPLGGQGMNTGIGDAVNFAWKLAMVLDGRAGAGLLDTYAEERMPFAKRLVQTTDRAFELVSATGSIANRMRLDVVPHVVARLFASPRIRRWMYGTVSQTRVHYPHSALSEGRAGRVRGGDRLPWIGHDGNIDNFAPLKSFAWQAHVYGEATGSLQNACDALHVPIHRFDGWPSAEKAGLERAALYLVRPDGYVALAAGADDATEKLGRYLVARGLRFDAPGQV